MKHLLTILCSLYLAGCAATSSIYPYRAVTGDCDCEVFHTTTNKVDFVYRASYMMRNGIATTIDVEISNRSSDTLSLDLSTVRVFSKNIPYQYNGKFLPMPALHIPPRGNESVRLEGSSVEKKEDWHKIAGERLTVTIQGMRLGNMTLPADSVVFVPVNPKLQR